MPAYPSPPIPQFNPNPSQLGKHLPWPPTFQNNPFSEGICLQTTLLLLLSHGDQPSNPQPRKLFWASHTPKPFLSQFIRVSSFPNVSLDHVALPTIREQCFLWTLYSNYVIGGFWNETGLLHFWLLLQKHSMKCLFSQAVTPWLSHVSILTLKFHTNSTHADNQLWFFTTVTKD